MGMTDDQKEKLVRLRQYLAHIVELGDPRIVLTIDECTMLINWVDGLQEENENWKEQCQRLTKLADRIHKDIYEEVIIQRMKTS